MQTSYANDAIFFMQAYKEQGYRPDAILAMNAGFISPAFVQTLGDDANYVLSREVWALDLGETRPLIRQVNELYQARYGANLTGNSARAFTGLMVLADAINRAGSVEAEDVRQALLETDLAPEQLIMPWDGVRFDPDTGQNTLAKGIIVQIQDQAYYTVWPWDLASRDLIWPMPDWGQ
jgi:branched-chain amino acid transport system substrate-binding protein